MAPLIDYNNEGAVSISHMRDTGAMEYFFPISVCILQLGKGNKQREMRNEFKV